MGMFKKQTGFTIIELMVVTAVIAVFAMLAVPAFQGTIKNNRMTTSTNNLVGIFFYARSEAIKRSEDVRVCKSNNGLVCDDNLTWNDGWLTWNDANADGVIDPGEEILKVGEGFNQDITVTATADVVNTVRFTSRGLASVSGTWTICDSRGSVNAKAAIITPSGRVRASTTDHLGGALACP